MMAASVGIDGGSDLDMGLLDGLDATLSHDFGLTSRTLAARCFAARCVAARSVRVPSLGLVGPAVLLDVLRRCCGYAHGMLVPPGEAEKMAWSTRKCIADFCRKPARNTVPANLAYRGKTLQGPVCPGSSGCAPVAMQHPDVVVLQRTTKCSDATSRSMQTTRTSSVATEHARRTVPKS